MSELIVNTVADLAARSDEQRAAAAHHRLLARQRQTHEALSDGRCTTACAGSPNRWGDCTCPCGGRLHAALWATALVPMGDW